MLKRFASPLLLLRYAGLFTWCSVGVLLMLRWSPFRNVDVWPRISMLWFCFLLFGAAFYWLATTGARLRYGSVHFALMLLTLAAIAISFYTRSGLGVVLLMVAGGILPWLMSTSRATGWLVAQNAAMIPVIASFPAYSWTDAIFQGALFLVFSSFIFMISLAALQQSQSRDAMRKINAELRATQSLLAESERVAERLRISRELHDLVGHHLTALSLNLEVASHLIDGKAREYVLKAQSLSKLLLSDVREVVSSLRESDAIELGAALRNLVEGVPSLQVHLDVPEPFGMNDPSRAQVVLRLTQEIITNTLKHARARQLWLSFKVDAGALELLARDDGIGSASVNPGNGLSGMRERLAQFGGVLSVTSQPGKGFKLAAHLPLEAFA